MSTARCRCGHLQGQHYRDRKGRPQCVFPCGCAGFRTPNPDGAGGSDPSPAPSGTTHDTTEETR